MSIISDDLNITHSCSEDAAERQFIQVIGCIEELVIDEKFLKLLSSFMDEHWTEFDDSDENKLIYMDIFEKYNAVIEKYIDEQLTKRIPGFNMNKFEEDLRFQIETIYFVLNGLLTTLFCRLRQNELDGEIFEILSTFTDFLAFKLMFLDYKAVSKLIFHA